MIGKNLIDGQWRASDRTFTTLNPSDTNDVVGNYAQASIGDVEEAFAAARRAQPAWAAGNLQARVDLLHQVGAALLARAAELGALISREEGKTLPEGIAEVKRAAQVFHYFAGEALRHPGQFLPSLRDGHNIFVSYEPLGTVALITPWNFPLALPAWKTAAALCCGNSVVLKPSEFCPGVVLALGKILIDAGLPNGVFNIVMGDGRELGQTLVQSADGVSFTGATPTGRAILLQAAATMTKTQLELGGKNPLIVLDDADLDIAVAVALDGTFMATGQRCTSSSRLIVTRKIHDAFVERLAAAVAAIRVGHAFDSTSQIGPVATLAQLQKNLNFIARAKADGAECIAGGGIVEGRTPGHYLAPTLFVGTRNDMHLNREEVFGPVAGIIKVENCDEAIAVALDCELALSSGICTTNLRSAERFRRASRAGLVAINTPTAGIEYHAPFGGRMPSGFGIRELGSAASDFFTEGKTTYINHGVI
jgi:alpha-ketoglutaric semialdehyde dehydrogenase